jgi:hypothetical protein
MPEFVRENSRDRARYSIRNRISSNLIERMRNTVRASPNVQLPREFAYTRVHPIDYHDVGELKSKLGLALNLQEQPAEFQALFDGDGAIQEADLQKVCYLSWINRAERNFTRFRSNGTNVRPENINTIFSVDLTNNTLGSYYNSRQRRLSLAKGGATALMNYLVGPNSPLLAEGYEYVVLQANSNGLARTYYANKFGFIPLYGIPVVPAFIQMEEFLSLSPAPTPPGLAAWDVRVLSNENYVRRVNGEVYTIYENSQSGPIMYKKIGEPLPGAAAPAAVAPVPVAPAPVAPVPAAPVPVPVAVAPQQSFFNRLIPSWLRRRTGGRRGRKRRQTQKRRVR